MSRPDDEGVALLKKRIKKAFFKKVVARFLEAAPLWMEAIGAGVFMSRVMDKNPGFGERLKGLEGKIFYFEATDVKKGFYLVIKGGEAKVVPHVPVPPDVSMRGSFKVLADVLAGRVDPDTVFFSRRLEITGDTGAAIHFKNILAALS